MLTKSEAQRRFIEAVNELSQIASSFILPMDGQAPDYPEKSAKYEQIKAMHNSVLTLCESYVSEQYELGHDRGYEDAENDYIAGHWDA